MYSHSDLHAKFGELTQQAQAADDQALANDPGVIAARSQLATRQNELTGLKNYISALPPAQRFQYQGNLDAAFEAIEQAKAAELKATNEFHRSRRLQALEQAKAEQARQLEEQQRAYSQQAEAQAKEEHWLAYLAAGSTEEQFNAIWPKKWEEILDKRAAEQQRELRNRMYRTIGYPSF